MKRLLIATAIMLMPCAPTYAQTLDLHPPALRVEIYLESKMYVQSLPLAAREYILRGEERLPLRYPDGTVCLAQRVGWHGLGVACGKPEGTVKVHLLECGNPKSHAPVLSFRKGGAAFTIIASCVGAPWSA